MASDQALGGATSETKNLTENTIRNPSAIQSDLIETDNEDTDEGKRVKSVKP